MKTIKIALGFLLLIGAGKEYISASRQLGSFFSPEIILAIITMLILSTWLIGSGFSQKKFNIKSFESIKFLIISILTFATVAYFTLLSYVVPDNFISVNGISIPMNNCIDGSERIISNEKARKEYCLCLAEKITADSSLIIKYKNELEKGRLGEILIKLQKEEKFAKLDLENCFKNAEMKWTENVAKLMKVNWISELKGTDFEETNDIETYCDCLLNEYRKYPLSKIMEDDFQKSELAISIENNCNEKSKK